MSARERPILFSGPMVRAIVAGKKTQTRRLVRDVGAEAELHRMQPGFPDGTTRSVFFAGDGEPFSRKPYAAVGDRLWVRETFQLAYLHGEHFYNDMEGFSRSYSTTETAGAGDDDGRWCCADGDAPTKSEHWDGWGPKMPSIFMPRWASRILLEVTDVRIERLQDITEEDARAEGPPLGELIPCTVNGVAGEAMIFDPRKAFAVLWDGINGKRSPWASEMTVKSVSTEES